MKTRFHRTFRDTHYFGQLRHRKFLLITQSKQHTLLRRQLVQQCGEFAIEHLDIHPKFRLFLIRIRPATHLFRKTYRNIPETIFIPAQIIGHREKPRT